MAAKRVHHLNVGLSVKESASVFSIECGYLKAAYRNSGQNDGRRSLVKGRRQDPVARLPDERKVLERLGILQNLFEVNRRRTDETHRLSLPHKKRLE